MKLRVIKDYSNGTLRFQRGRTYETDDTLAEWLLRDSPNSFRERSGRRVRMVKLRECDGMCVVAEYQ